MRLRYLVAELGRLYERGDVPEAEVSAVLSRGPVLDARDKVRRWAHVTGQDGRTALHVASERGSEAVVRLLLERGAPASLLDKVVCRIQERFRTEIALSTMRALQGVP
jgi:hypothetical protein